MRFFSITSLPPSEIDQLHCFRDRLASFRYSIGIASVTAQPLMKRFAFEESEMARVLLLVSRGQDQALPSPVPVAGRGGRAPEREFVCKTCDRVFPSFQALGGHRASHKKPRLDADGNGLSKPKLHGCSVCGLEFAIGQALGGHMRRHRAMTGGRMAPATIFVDKKPDSNDDDDASMKRGLWLDLNHPPCDDGADTVEEYCGHDGPGITFHQFLDTGTMAMDCVGY